MDRKSIAILAVCFLLMLAWGPLVNRLYPPLPVARSSQASTNTTQPGSTHRSAAILSSNLSEVKVETPVLAPSPSAFVRPGASEEVVVLENDQVRYYFTSHGGGIKLVELKQYPETVGVRKKPNGSTNQLATLNTDAPVPVFTILGNEAVQGDGVFALTKTATGMRAEKTLTNGLHLVKDFQLSSNYLLNATVRLENQSGQPLSLPPQEWVVGTSTPMSPKDNSLLLGVMWYNGVKAEEVGDAWFANYTMGCGCLPSTPRQEYLGGDGQTNVAWAAVHNQFFTLVVVPQQGAPHIVARRAPLSPLAAEPAANSKAVTNGYQASLVYSGTNLLANQVLERRFQLYAGPKEYNTLAKLSTQFDNNLDLIMGFGGFFGFFSKGLLLSMNALHHSLHLSYGFAIIAITLIIKLIFWPLTAASTRSMKRMSALQPQMKEIQAKYKEEPRRMQAKLMEFMKQNKVSPMGGCLPMLLQIPVFIGFYKMLQTAIELRGASFLWVADLSRSDTIFVIPGLDFPVNPLPLIMGVTMLWQSHMTPPSPGMDPMQQKMMKYMPLMFIVILYNFSAGLSLYWTVQNLLTIAQMKLTRNVAVTPVTPTPGVSAKRR